MSNNGIEDILIGESYKTTKKKGNGFKFFIIILLIISAVFVIWYFFINKEVVNEKEAFSQNVLNIGNKKLQDKDFYSTILKRLLEENSELSSNITITSTEKIEELQGIDINNFDFELNSTNDLKNKNFNSKLLAKYSGNDFIEVQSIVNDNKFAVFSGDVVNKYVGIKAENFNDIFNSNIDLNFIYEFINSEELDLSEEDVKNYLESYYKKAYNQIPEEKFSQKENIVISKNNNYINVTAYEMNLTQNELKDILDSLLVELKNDEKLLNSIVSKEKLTLDLNSNTYEQNETTNQNVSETQNETLDSESGENTTIQLVPVTEVNFQTAEEINVENQEEIQEEIQEEVQEKVQEENTENQEVQIQEHIEEAEGLVLENNEDEQVQENREFSTSDLIKILLGRKVNISGDKIIEKIEEYINNLEGNGIIVTIYVSEEKTEKISITLPNENKLDIQFLEDTEKENTIEFTYLYKNSEYKSGISINIDEVHNSASSSIKIVKNYIENEKVNKKESLAIQSNGTQNSNTISSDIIVTFSTNNSETKFVADSKLKFLSNDDLVLDKLTEENSVFLDDLLIDDRNATIQVLKEKIQSVLREKKSNMNLIDLNSGTSIVSPNLEDMTSNNHSLIKKLLEDKINDLRSQAEENGEEFTIQNLSNLEIEGFEVNATVEEDRAVVVIDVYTFIIDRDFNISDT